VFVILVGICNDDDVFMVYLSGIGENWRKRLKCLNKFLTILWLRSAALHLRFSVFYALLLPYILEIGVVLKAMFVLIQCSCFYIFALMY